MTVTLVIMGSPNARLMPSPCSHENTRKVVDSYPELGRNAPPFGAILPEPPNVETAFSLFRMRPVSCNGNTQADVARGRARMARTTRTAQGELWPPLKVQVGVVALLFLAALGTLAYTGLAMLNREGRRTDAERALLQADAALRQLGREPLANVPPWPGMSDTEWTELDRQLAARAAAALGRFTGVEGGASPERATAFWGPSAPPRAARPAPGRGRGHRPKSST